MSKKPTKTSAPEVVQDGPKFVPVSQTHQVKTADGAPVSAYETELERRQTELRGVEDEILNESLGILRGALKFADVPFDADAPDGEFYEKNVGCADPEKLFRVIKSAQMKASEAPVGLILAQKTAMGIIKARASEKGEMKALNVAVQVVTTMPEFKRIEVE